MTMPPGYAIPNATLGGFSEAGINLTDVQLVAPVSLTSDWVTLIGAGRIATQDGVVAGTITNPVLDIISVLTRPLLRRGRAGTTLLLSMGYAGTPSTNPVVAVFGRTQTGRWQRLKNKAGATSCTLTPSPDTDVTDGTLKYTDPDIVNNAFDGMGCDEFIAGVLTAYAVSAGSTATTILQGKLI